jgi:hypothetical protein
MLTTPVEAGSLEAEYLDTARTGCQQTRFTSFGASRQEWHEGRSTSPSYRAKYIPCILSFTLIIRISIVILRSIF